MSETTITGEHIENVMLEEMASALSIPEDEIAIDKPINDFGLDSMAMVRLGEVLAEILGRELEPTLLWYYPTVASLAEHLQSEWNLSNH